MTCNDRVLGIDVHVHCDGGGLAGLDRGDVVEAHAEGSVSAGVGSSQPAIDPDGGLAKRSLEVEPEGVAGPLLGESEYLAVPQHVARDVRPAGATAGAGLLRGCGGDQAVVRQLDQLPVGALLVRHATLRRLRPRVWVDGRLVILPSFLGQARSVLPAEVKGEGLPAVGEVESTHGHERHHSELQRRHWSEGWNMTGI